MPNVGAALYERRRNRNISKTYGGQAALSPISLTIGKGEIFALLGPNGAGKTTLLRILTGILLPDTGRVRILEADGMEQVRSQVGYLPEERGLYKKQKVGAILVYLAMLKGLSRDDAQSRTRTVLTQVGMDAHENSLTDALSKGMAQRVQIAAALVHDPPFVILDEPFSGLDPVSSRQAQQIVLDEKARGRTILLSTHQMATVEKLCDRLVMLHRGQVVLRGTVADIRDAVSEGILRVSHGQETLDAALLPPSASVRESRSHETDIQPGPVAPRDVLAHLLANHVDVTGFEIVSPSLEEIFVRVVGEQG